MARGLLLAWGLFLAAGFGLALSLEPDSRGFGTHRQLGLAPCTVRTLFGIPCPTCGMTTCFANFVRGEILPAARASTSGLLLAIACAAQLPWIAMSVCRGRLLGVRHPDRVALAVIVPLGLVCLAEWLLRVFL